MDNLFSMNDEPHVSVLMATYNGELYVAEQIDSLLRQSWSNWTLYVRDDGSSDDTLAILDRYAGEHYSRIRMVPSDGNRLGVDGNFARLLEIADGPYFMFCDQDDIWLTEKIEKSVQCLRSLEEQTPPGTPLLVYTDLRPADGNLRPLGTSMWRYGKHDPESGKRLNRLLLQNMVYGCTILMNEALKRAALPIPVDAVTYDWWFSSVAACLGSSDYVAEPTLIYRLHGRNTVGATSWGARYIWSKMIRFFDPGGPIESLQQGQRQAGALLDRYGERLGDDQRELLKAYATLGAHGFLARRMTLLKYGLFKTGIVRNVGLFARV